MGSVIKKLDIETVWADFDEAVSNAKTLSKEHVDEMEKLGEGLPPIKRPTQEDWDDVWKDWNEYWEELCLKNT